MPNWNSRAREQSKFASIGRQCPTASVGLGHGLNSEHEIQQQQLNNKMNKMKMHIKSLRMQRRNKWYILAESWILKLIRPSSMNENEKWKRGFRGFRGFNRNASTARVLWRLKAKKKWNQLYPIVSILKEWNCRNAWDATNEASDKPGLDTQS